MGANVSADSSETILYERFAARVYYLALRGCGSPADAEDVRAETFLRVFQAIRADRLQSPEALPAFVLGVTRNVLNELYVQRRKAASQLTADTEEPSAPSHEGAWIDRDVRRAIDAAIAELKPRDQAVLRLHYYDELPAVEIAKRLGIAEERVRLVKSRALKRFRDAHQALQRQGPQPT